MANDCAQTLTRWCHFKGVTKGHGTMIYSASKNRLRMKKISRNIQRREALRDTANKISGKIYWSYSLIFDATMYVLWPVAFQVLSSPQVQSPKEARAVGWRACSTSPAPGEGRWCCRVGASSSSSSLRWRPQPMLPGYLLDKRAGNREQGDEKGKEYTLGKLGWL